MSTKAHGIFAELIDLVATLRGEGGCPWDRAQTADSLKEYLLEEAYEVVDAIEQGTAQDVRDELGDLLFQIIFLARLFDEQGRFDLAEAAGSIKEKMIRRHPHVFGDKTARTPAEVVESWNAIKRSEDRDRKRPTSSLLDGVPKGAPALLRACLLSERASTTGFDWPAATDVFEKLGEELGELRRCLASGDDPARVKDELGDVLFTLANLARKLGVNPETALRSANDKFARRFRHMEGSLDPDRKESAADLERLWEEAKKHFP